MLPTLTEEDALTVTDIRQWGYCGRVVYYERCLPRVRPVTYKMQHGQRVHESQSRHALRRVLTTAEADEGERRFHVRYYSPTLQLSGMLDELIVTADGRFIPVDYKNTTSVAKNHRWQLTAYALLIEAMEDIHVPVGYIYLIPSHKMVRVAIDEALRTTVWQTMADIRWMIEREQIPPAPPPESGLCGSCEFRRFCNDVE